MKNNELALGIDIGGTNTKMGLFDLDGNLLAFKTVPTPFGSDPLKFISDLALDWDETLQKDFGLKLGDPRLIGVGAGAPMANYFSGHIPEAPNVGWKNVPLKSHFETFFKVPAVIENDANLAALGEKRWGSGKDFSDFVLITLGTGVGSGLILNNELYRGYNGLGAEGGHILIPHSKQRLCSCGGVNHLESYLSAKGIKQTIHELTGEDWTIEKLGKLYNEKDHRAETIIHSVAQELVLGLVSVASILGPQAFIIGGGVSKLGHVFNQVIENKLNEQVHFSLKGKIKIVSASVSAEKGAIHGGAALIIHEVSKRK